MQWMLARTATVRASIEMRRERRHQRFKFASLAQTAKLQNRHDSMMTPDRPARYRPAIAIATARAATRLPDPRHRRCCILVHVAAAAAFLLVLAAARNVRKQGLRRAPPLRRWRPTDARARPPGRLTTLSRGVGERRMGGVGYE